MHSQSPLHCQSCPSASQKCLCINRLRQYSSGNRIVVAERSASLMTQILVPVRSVYAESGRNPCSSENSFSLRSPSLRSPQSPAACRVRNVPGCSPDSSSAASAPGVATSWSEFELCRWHLTACLLGTVADAVVSHHSAPVGWIAPQSSHWTTFPLSVRLCPWQLAQDSGAEVQPSATTSLGSGDGFGMRPLDVLDAVD